MTPPLTPATDKEYITPSGNVPNTQPKPNTTENNNFSQATITDETPAPQKTFLQKLPIVGGLFK